MDLSGCVMMSNDITSKGEFRMLPDVLQVGETPKCIITGMYNNRSGMLVATDRRILFLKKKLFGSIESETILYETLTSVEWNRGMTGGDIKLHANRKSHKITNVEKDVVRDFATYLETRVMGGDGDSLLARLRMPRLANSPHGRLYAHDPQANAAPTPQPAPKDVAPPMARASPARRSSSARRARTSARFSSVA